VRVGRARYRGRVVTSDTSDTAVPTVPPDLGPAPLDARLGGVLGGRTAKAIEKAFGYRTVGESSSTPPAGTRSAGP